MAAPEEVRKFLNHPIGLPQILKYIKWREQITEKRRATSIQIYADEEEKKAMDLCHQRSIQVLADFLESLPNRAVLRALDCAGGDGRLSTSFLMKTYQCVDLFDQCPVAVKKAKEAMQGHKAFGYVDQATMQAFEWKFHYNMIFMVWCSGYLTSLQLSTFLQRAQQRLMPSLFRPTRQSPGGSFIILLDNVKNDDEELYEAKGQYIRSAKELEEVFAQAGLIIYKASERAAMPKNFRDVKVWALY